MPSSRFQWILGRNTRATISTTYLSATHAFRTTSRDTIKMCADIHLLRLYVGQIFFECVLKTSTRRPCPAEHFMHRTGEKRNFIWINFSPHPLVSARRGEVAARSTLALISHRQCRICSNETKLGRMSRKSLSPPVAQSAVPWSITSAGLCQHVVLPTKHNIPLLAFFFFSFRISLMYLFSQQNGAWEDELQQNLFGMLYSLENRRAWRFGARANAKLWVTVGENGNPGRFAVFELDCVAVCGTGTNSPAQRMKK